MKRGEIACLIGANGAGKTTLFRSLAGLIKPTAGAVTFDGRPLPGGCARSCVSAGLTLVPEGRRLFASMSVRDNLLMGAYLRLGSRHGSRSAIDADLESVYAYFPRLAERRHQDAATLSGEEQQMCAIGAGSWRARSCS